MESWLDYEVLKALGEEAEYCQRTKHGVQQKEQNASTDSQLRPQEAKNGEEYTISENRGTACQTQSKGSTADKSGLTHAMRKMLAKVHNGALRQRPDSQHANSAKNESQLQPAKLPDARQKGDNS